MHGQNNIKFVNSYLQQHFPLPISVHTCISRQYFSPALEEKRMMHLTTNYFHYSRIIYAIFTLYLPPSTLLEVVTVYVPFLVGLSSVPCLNSTRPSHRFIQSVLSTDTLTWQTHDTYATQQTRTANTASYALQTFLQTSRQT